MNVAAICFLLALVFAVTQLWRDAARQRDHNEAMATEARRQATYWHGAYLEMRAVAIKSGTWLPYMPEGRPSDVVAADGVAEQLRNVVIVGNVLHDIQPAPPPSPPAPSTTEEK